MGRLYSRLLETADRRGRCVAIVSKDKNITFEDLQAAIEGCAAKLAQAGVRKRHYIHADIQRPEYFLTALVAANKIGANLIVAPFSDSGKIDLSIDFKLTDESSPPEKRIGALVIDNTWFTEDDIHPVSNVIDSDAVQCVFTTSGSTGERKYLAVSERNLLNQLNTAERDFIDENTRVLCTIGARTIFATEVHLTTLLKGGSTVLLPLKSDFLAHYIDLFAIHTLVSTPIILEHLVKLDFPKKLYRTLDHVTLSGAAATQSLIDAVAGKICSNVTLTYGSSEIGATAKFNYSKDQYTQGNVGRVFRDIDIEIVDEVDNPAKVGAEGFVRLKRDNVLADHRYLNLAINQSERFSGDWFYPGDSGSLDEQGNLIIAGRDDNVINVSGNKYSLERIESEIEAIADCRCVALRGDRTGEIENIILIVHADREMKSRRISNHVEKQFRRLGIEGIYQVDAIAVTDSGKKDRATMRQRMQAKPRDFRKLA